MRGALGGDDGAAVEAEEVTVAGNRSSCSRALRLIRPRYQGSCASAAILTRLREIELGVYRSAESVLCLHASQQTVYCCNTADVVIHCRELRHDKDDVRGFYTRLTGEVIVAFEASGADDDLGAAAHLLIVTATRL